MPKEQVEIWTCQRCGETVTVQARIPKGWAEWYGYLILCPSCNQEFEKWLKGGEL